MNTPLTKESGDLYKIPAMTRIGHVHLKVSDLKRSLNFYCGLLGFELITMYGQDAAFISAGGYHHHIGLNVWYSRNSPPAPKNIPVNKLSRLIDSPATGMCPGKTWRNKKMKAVRIGLTKMRIINPSTLNKTHQGFGLPHN